MKQKFPEIDFGLYHDDGLGVVKRTPKTKLERLKNDLHAFFREEFGLFTVLDTDLTLTSHFGQF